MGKPKKTKTDADIATPAFASAMMAVSPVATKAWLDVLSESTRFVADRLQQDLDIQKAMLACKNPTELLQVQTEFFQKAIEQYTDEAKRLFEMMSKATEDTIKDVQSGHSREYNDVPL
ncbi:phasin family protein [Marimonas arenosa]|uniref:Phasin family protein n=1 Tax=Marimonas arenosa TaxID=1795305 RepID=A0AAE3WCI6_9RHOB|nr:phasin family protein [Marimonas arenosa]MDQ2090706.1 phasin family protein [Marimonas arenosa]